MSKNKIADYDQTADNNEDIAGIGIKGSDPVRNMDNALREIMSHLADMNRGDAPLDDTFCVADLADNTKKVRIAATNVTAGQTRVLTAPDVDGTIWTNGNDGQGSGLDADLLDGQEGAYYLDADNFNTGTISDALLPDEISSNIAGNADTATNATTADHALSADFIKSSSDAIKSASFDFTDVADNANISLKLPTQSGTISIREFTVSIDAPTGGGDGDIWLQVDS